MTDDYYIHMQMASMREIMVGSGGCGESYTSTAPLRETYKGFPTTCTDSRHDEACRVAHMSASDQKSFTKAQALAKQVKQREKRKIATMWHRLRS